VTRFNNDTQDRRGEVVPTIINVYDDRTFDYILKTPPASELLKKAAGIKKGSGNPLTTKVGSVTQAQLREIAEKKMADLSAHDLDAAAKIIAGTARQMGLEIKD
jgi:large subunit ribosomal protein L11